MLGDLLHLSILIVAFILIAVGIVLVPLSMPGTWLIVLAGIFYTIFYPFDGGASSGWWVCGVLLTLAIFGEVIEFVVGTFGSKAVKVSNGAIVAAFVGGIAGLIIGVPIFLIGSLIGLFIGAFLGAFLYEMFTLKDFSRALVTAFAVLATRLVASTLKTLLAVAMGVFLALKIF